MCLYNSAEDFLNIRQELFVATVQNITVFGLGVGFEART